MASHSVTFAPLRKTVTVETGTSLLEAAGTADIVIGGACGGDGICGRCKMIVQEGAIRGGASGLLTREEIQRGVVLACQSFVEGDLRVEIPPDTLVSDRVVADEDAQRFRAIQPGITSRPFARSPLVRRVFLQLPPPTLENHLADAERVQEMVTRQTGIESMQMGLRVLRGLPDVLRENGFAVTATIGRRSGVAEVMEVVGGDCSGCNYAAVVDVGTTTVVVHLVDLNELTTVDAQACFNSQAVYGREVTARILATERKGVNALQELVVEDINRLVTTLVTRNHVQPRDVTAVVCAGNTTMLHILLGLPASNIRRHPFIATSIEPPTLRAAEIGLRINPRGLVHCVPGISSWVGGDLTAGILATGLHERDETAMLIDVGTNGEIILGNKDWLMACSASTGPALEGASVQCGMIAEKGAIEKVYVEDDQVRCKVIGNVAPKGLCGSGIIDLIAVLLDRGVIDRAGQFVAHSDPAVAFVKGRGRYVVAGQAAGAVKDVYLAQDDLENVITAKAAIFAATKIMLDRLDLGFDQISRVFLAGGFGSYIDRRNAIKIGLLPDLPLPRIQYVGNTSIWGAKLAALSSEALDELRAIRRKTTYYDLLGSDDYVEQFRQAMFLPHTDIGLFPSLQQGKVTAA
ncbi:DUF4445 domain-containing protein [bacterium]|nr:DUF4445 domain-containing protein [bacterium]